LRRFFPLVAEIRPLSRFLSSWVRDGELPRLRAAHERASSFPRGFPRPSFCPPPRGGGTTLARVTYSFLFCRGRPEVISLFFSGVFFPSSPPPVQEGFLAFLLFEGKLKPPHFFVPPLFRDVSLFFPYFSPRGLFLHPLAQGTKATYGFFRGR